MREWKGIIGRRFTVDQFCRYARGLKGHAGWKPNFIVLHNTGVPTLKMYPNGITEKYIKSAAKYYRDVKGWSAGPHLFIDDKYIWVFTPLTLPGVHAPSWNQVSLGVEMLGNYDADVFDSGRGLLVQQNTVDAIAILNTVFGFDPASMKLHREDPKTDHHCPGDNVNKSNFIQLVSNIMPYWKSRSK